MLCNFYSWNRIVK